MERQAVGDEALRALAKRLAARHTRAPRQLRAKAEGTRDALRDRWKSDFEAVRPFHGAVLDAAEATEIELLVQRFLAGREALFDTRIATGRLVRAPVNVLDRASSPEVIDGLDDAARVAADLERLNSPELAQRFMGWYADYADDPAPPSLRHHYVAFHAFDLALQACLRGRAATAEARALARVALRHLRAGAVALILVGGPPESGKSGLAGKLAKRMGCPLLSSPNGSYDLWAANGVYAALLDRARQYLRLGETVIMDASWAVPSHREEAATIASATRSDLVTIRCETPDERPEPRALYARSVDPALPWPNATVIDTGGPADGALDQALRLVRPFGAGDLWHRRPWTNTITRVNGHADQRVRDRRPARRPTADGRRE